MRMTMPDPILFKVFVQANTIKGWRYLDDAGRIMNEFADQFDDMNVGLQGLVMKSPGAVVDEARVSPRDMWIGFAKPATVQYVQDQANRFIASVSDIIGVESYSRMGVRFQYIREVADLASALPHLATSVLGPELLNIGQSVKAFDGTIEVAVPGDLHARVQITPVRTVDPTADPALPAQGLMVDADVSRSATMNRTEARRVLQAAVAWAEEDMRALAERVARGGLG